MDTIRPIEDEAALRACFPVMHQLRPHLADADELVARWRRQVEEGYRLIAVWRDGTPVALAGYRLQENLVVPGADAIFRHGTLAFRLCHRFQKAGSGHEGVGLFNLLIWHLSCHL